MLFKLWIALLCLVSVVGCGIFNGTNTGNPGGINFDAPADQLKLYTDRLNSQICLTIKYCDANVNLGTCIDSNNTNPQIPVELKIESYYHTLNFLREAEALKKVAINQSSATSCLSSIQKVDCASAEFQSAYDSNDPNNFTNAFLLLRFDSECGNIFSPL